MKKLKMDITNADLQIGDIKINSISTSSIVIFGDAKSFYPRNVSITRGVIKQPTIASLGPGGPVGAIR